MKTPLLFLKLVAFAWLLAPDSAVAFCNPQTGRWLNRDPIAETGGRNLHHFNYNDAVGHIDTAGKQSYLTGSFPIPWPSTGMPAFDPRPPEWPSTLPYPPPPSPPLPAPIGKGPVQVCTRPLQGLKKCTIIVHCYLDLGGGEAWDYDNDGVHADPWPDSSKKRCVNALCPTGVAVEDVRKQINDERTNGKWDGPDYKFLRHNCCHWVDSVLKALGCKGVESHFPGYRLPTQPSSY